MHIRKIAALAATALALVAVTGCGDDDDDDGGNSGATASSITKAELISKADAICSASSARVRAASEKELGANPSEDKITDFINSTALPEQEKQLEQIKELGAPEADVAEISAMLDAVQKGIDTVKDDPAAQAKDGADNPFDDASKKAQAYGFKACGN